MECTTFPADKKGSRILCEPLILLFTGCGFTASFLKFLLL